MLAVFVTLIVLLREVLLPFVTGMVLAYLLNPVAQKIERQGLNRLVATLLILVVVVIALTVLLIFLVPVVVRELADFIESFPLYIRRLHSLATDPSRPWLSKIIGEGLRMPRARSASLRRS
jgi:predicted PurR-regulated permease PerM